MYSIEMVIQENMRVSVIILTYQKFQNIYNAIDSVLMQDYPDMELLIFDDCSDNFDFTNIQQYIEKNITSNIKNFKILTGSENLGTVRNANLAANEADGVYIRFLGVDDEFIDNKVISDTIKYMEQTDALVSTSLSAVYDDRMGKLLYSFPSQEEVRKINFFQPQELFGELAIFGNFIGAPGIIFRKEFFTLHGGFDEAYRLTEDFPTWLRLLRNNQPIPCMERITVKYRTNGISAKQNKDTTQGHVLYNELGMIYEKEILPYTDLLTYFQQRICLFICNRIVSWRNYSRKQKVVFFIYNVDIILWRKYISFNQKMRWHFERMFASFCNNFIL